MEEFPRAFGCLLASVAVKDAIFLVGTAPGGEGGEGVCFGSQLGDQDFHGRLQSVNF